MTARRPADIAAGLRAVTRVMANYPLASQVADLLRDADELDALDARWPTADEIAEARAVVKWLAPRPRRQLTTFLDRLDPPPPEPQADDDVGGHLLSDLASEMRRNSERWFPDLHASGLPLEVFFALGLAGETGEAVEEVKKALRHGVRASTRPGLGPELADVFVYLLLLADEAGVDLLAEYQAKVRENEARWGDQPEPEADDVDPWALLARIVKTTDDKRHLNVLLDDIDAARAALDARGQR